MYRPESTSPGAGGGVVGVLVAIYHHEALNI